MIGLQQTLELAEQNTELMLDAQRNTLDLQREAVEAYFEATGEVVEELDAFDPADTLEAVAESK